MLRGLTWKDVIVYLDDVNVLRVSFEDHVNNLGEVIGRFKKYNLKLKPRKWFLFQTEKNVSSLVRKLVAKTVSISQAKPYANWIKSQAFPVDR